MAGFITALAAALTADPFAEKLLVAPSYRVGRQWLDRVALAAGGVANVRTVTLSRLIRDQAEPELSRRSLRVAGRAENAALAAAALAAVRRESLWEGYFTSLPPSLELAETLIRTLDELETAGVANRKIAAAADHPGKGAELAELARRVRRERAARGLAGPGALLTAALDRVKEAGDALPTVVIPASLAAEPAGMERRILQAWPAGRVRVIPDGASPDAGSGAAQDRAFFRADRIENEVREVFRRIMAGGVPLDRVELVTADPAAYDPLIVAVGLEVFGGRPEDLPLTFHLGLPAWLSRPVRLLAAWLAWLDRDQPPEGLARMIESGLLADAWRRTAPAVSRDALAAALRRLPLHGDPDAYQARLRADAAPALAPALVWLADWLRQAIPPAGRSPADRNQALLAAAARLAALRGPGDAKLDAYAASALAREIADWLPHAGLEGFDAWSWLDGLAVGLRVMGLGPLPGRAHVGDIRHGGQAGRPQLFVLGLDDGRFPGAARQDPVLLDTERSGLSPALALSGQRRRQRAAALERLLGNAEGAVTLSHAGREAGRELFPAPEFTAWAERAGAAIAAATLLPATPEAALGRAGDWLPRLLRRPVGALAAAIVTDFPHLARGERALAARASARFTEYDGRVPEAGAERFPANGDWCLSPTELERYASCPRDFFYRDVLGVKPPDQFEPTPGRWLPGNERGTLLHDLFQDFLADAAGADDDAALHALLDAALARYTRRFPPRDGLAYSREVRELRETCMIFLNDERRRRQDGTPLYCEVGIGFDREPATPWDRREPAEILVSDQRRLRVKGRIDRIDRLHDGGLLIMDYKSGRADKFSAADVLRQGRQLQPLLYTHMLSQTRADAGAPEPVKGFIYYFPMPREEGKDICFLGSDLGRERLAVVNRLLALLEGGCFPLSTDKTDLLYSDYAAVHEAGGDTVAAARVKVHDPDVPLLAEWTRLRAKPGAADA